MQHIAHKAQEVVMYAYVRLEHWGSYPKSRVIALE